MGPAPAALAGPAAPPSSAASMASGLGSFVFGVPYLRVRLLSTLLIWSHALLFSKLPISSAVHTTLTLQSIILSCVIIPSAQQPALSLSTMLFSGLPGSFCKDLMFQGEGGRAALR